MSDFTVETKEGKSQTQDRREASIVATPKPEPRKPMETTTKEGATSGTLTTKSE